MARQDFIDQLRALGYEVEERGENRLAFKYTIPVGKFEGKEIMLGFVVGDDFSPNPPSGPHISPRLLPIHPGGNHPEGGINESPFFGSEWQYWSRPFPDWNKTDRTVRTYIAHVRHLFETQ